jgi:hypothetical protein
MTKEQKREILKSIPKPTDLPVAPKRVHKSLLKGEGGNGKTDLPDAI